MATKVLVPRLGEGVEEVTVAGWLKQVGDSVNELEPLLEVESDKVTVEVNAPASGVLLKIERQKGEPVKVGELLAVIGMAGEHVESGGVQSPSTLEEKPVSSQLQEMLSPTRSTDIGFISPVVAKIAAEHSVDLSRLKGTGLNGRITKNDVLAFVEGGKKTIDDGLQAMVNRPSSMVVGAGDQLIKHSTMRKSIAAHMVESKHTSPHVLTVMEADMSRVVKHRAANKIAFERDGVDLTFTAYFMTAVVAGLKAYPLVNSSWNEEGVLIHKNINIGMATSLGDEGLIVPVIKGADNHSLLAMARVVNDLANRARNKKLQPDEVKGGTFTLTNHGISGSLFAFPIINQPQCGILGVGAMQKRVVVIDDAIAIRPMVYLSFVFDHRILDGASADWFLTKVKETLENWI
ncbi:2-oxoglutarate dehydrogenase E2 component (dihydrolipoamide succinyltransferase) [Anaerolineales bacterium]|nr:2-oxoglutarate dehydrogenase E2 component (dihydrolipoamide succinyltransferase) [Anaerolineales bacterium]